MSPFDFQERVRSSEARTTVLKAPTGLGKTDSVLVSWLHRRVTEPATTPRRLVWCLPGRALTEQVAAVAEDRIRRLVEAGLMQPIKVYRLMGGSEDNEAKLRPDEPAILVGTQDILLSRALNRGYARNPFRWPIDFALLNNDCFWVMDEVQLLGRWAGDFHSTCGISREVRGVRAGAFVLDFGDDRSGVDGDGGFCGWRGKCHRTGR